MSNISTVFTSTLPEKLEADKEKIVNNINAKYQFNITGEGASNWIVDLRIMSSGITEGECSDADCYITINGNDFINLIEGNLAPTAAVMFGKIKTKGEFGLVLKLAKYLS